MSELRKNPLLITILVLCALNLLMTSAVWLGRVPSMSHVEQASEVVDELPSYLDIDERKRLADRMQVLFNQGDTAGIYEVFDELAKTQLSFEDMADSLKQMEFIGQIESSVYTHHKAGKLGDFTAYTLYYSVRLSGGPFPTGVLKITVIDRGDSYGILGFNLFGGATQK